MDESSIRLFSSTFVCLVSLVTVKGLFEETLIGLRGGLTL
jgi:hypothetical protein